MCERPDDSVSLSRHGSQTGKIFSENLKNSGRTVVRPDGLGIEFLQSLESYFVRLLELICLSSHCKCAVAVLQLKSILGDRPKIKDSIEDPFRYETWLGSIRVGLHVREQGTTTASGVCECYCFVSSFVF
jgi:hypothetical protein